MVQRQPSHTSATRPAARAATAPEFRTVRRRAAAGWVPSEMVIGSFLLVFGITLAVLILTGAVRLGFAP
jgi:hypothetical protein